MLDVEDEGMDQFLTDLAFAMENFPKETEKMLKNAGSKAKTIIARHGRKLVGKKTDLYHKSWKRGKVWTEGPNYIVRVYNDAPHAHLIEDGHRIVGKDGSEHGFKPGYKVIASANAELEKKFDDILQKEMDKMVDKL